MNHFTSQLLQTHLPLINLITDIMENHSKLMRHLRAELLNNKQHILLMKGKAPNKCVVAVAVWLSEDSLSTEC